MHNHCRRTVPVEISTAITAVPAIGERIVGINPPRSDKNEQAKAGTGCEVIGTIRTALIALKAAGRDR